MILGNNSTRGCVNKTKDHLTKNFKFTDFMKPGSDVRTLTVPAKGAIEKLTKKGYKFVYPVTEDEFSQVLSILKGKSSVVFEYQNF
jgi:hypothetical protein